MRTHPDHTRLRIVALVCWTISSLWVIQFAPIQHLSPTPLLFIIKIMAGVLVIAIGIAFWTLANDRRAGVIVDKKGIMLNMGYYAAFVEWQNIAVMGISQHRSDVLTLGSSRQLGIQLHDVELFLQSYEERLPAASGPFGFALRRVKQMTRSLPRPHTITPREHLAHHHAKTGYDILIPEALLGQKIETFMDRTRSYRYLLALPHFVWQASEQAPHIRYQVAQNQVYISE